MRSDATPRAWRPRRRGVTLIEMMVTVALVILIMTIIVSVFRTTTNAVRGAQISQELDGNLRRLDATLRQDLVGATARFTPPLDPKDNLGYFEYGENSFADAQGEDTDDWLAFTVKAPPGQPFLGRYWNPNPNITNQASNPAIQPTIISSQYAEVIYFLRNGNLYRRVLLIVPNLAGNLAAGTSFTPGANSGMGTAALGWFGVNDISARPGPLRNGYTNINAGATTILPVPNTLGDLTNRENRAFRPRFTNNYVTATGFPDDFTGEGSTANPLPNGIPDFYQTLYPNVLTSILTVSGGVLVNEVPSNRTQFGEPGATADTMPFPYIYPGPYSIADSDGNAANGAIHGITSTSPVLNHSPLDLGDPLTSATTVQPQTYWCWPTWRETLSTAWTDPVFQPGLNSGAQSPGLSGVSPTFQALPPMTAKFRLSPQLYNDGAGTATFAATGSAYFSAWEDDLIMSGVRSFDIKAYDPNAGFAGTTPGYYDLGYNTGTWLSGFSSTYSAANYNTASTQYLPTFGHEGRIPPLRADLRLDAQYPTLVTAGAANFLNVGEDSTGTLRMRRVWDSWSTAYTNAPALPTDPTLGPAFGNRPVYPSYPPPYPAALRGIQIQIRVVNQPDSDRVKVLTIRQDFTDKL